MPLAVNVGGRVFHASEDTLRRCGSFLLRAFLFAEWIPGVLLLSRKWYILWSVGIRDMVAVDRRFTSDQWWKNMLTLPKWLPPHLK